MLQSQTVTLARTAGPSSATVAAYYDEESLSFYQRHWNAAHIHFGMFPDGCRLDAAVPEASLVAMIDAVAPAAAMAPGQLTVDAGCGVGGTAVYLARRSAVHVVGLNVSTRQLEDARARVAREDLGHMVELRYADCNEHLPFVDASVDHVVNLESACYYTERGRFLAECHRVLKPGGTLWAQDWMTPDGATAQQRSTLVAPVEHHWQLAELWSLERYQSVLAGLGFRVDGKYLGAEVVHNARFLDRGVHHLRAKELLGFELDATERRWVEQLSSLANAWFAGVFRLGIYAASKARE